MIEDREPDQVEGRVGDGAALVLKLVERDERVEVARRGRTSRPDAEAAEHRDDAADVEQRQRIPEAVLGGHQELRPLHVGAVADERLVA